MPFPILGYKKALASLMNVLWLSDYQLSYKKIGNLWRGPRAGNSGC
jgi:hypothetical protein